MLDITKYASRSGRQIKEDGSLVNVAEKIDSMHKALVTDKNAGVQLTGSFTRLSTEPKPTGADGAKDGNDLLLVDTGQVFVFYKDEWREI